MAFLEERFPPCYSFGAIGGPMFSTEVNKTTGGQRFANQNWSMPLHRWDVSSGIKSRADFAVYRNLFYNVKGRFAGFRFKDWMDFEATDQLLLAVVAGTTYQLQVAYAFGASTLTRAIYKPVNGSVTVKRRSSGGTLTTISPTIDYATGRVTVSGHTSGDTYRWSGQFDVPVAFTNDAMEARIENKSPNGSLLVSWPDVQVEEVRIVIP